MLKKYQVFISSTYRDLKDERQAAVEAILEAKHIPAGMELFSASDKSQTAIIRKWIRDSDIFVLILGGRYGSVDPRLGSSYIEMEYRYAMQQRKPLFALVLSEAVLSKKAASLGEAEVYEKDMPEKYRAFKDKVMSKLCAEIVEIKDIKTAILKSISNLLETHEMEGWIRSGEARSLMPDSKIKNLYGIKIKSPKKNEAVLAPVNVVIECKRRPPAELIIWCIEYNPALGTYWPKKRIEFQKKNTIRVKFGVGAHDDPEREILIAAVSQSGELLIDFFQKLSENFDRWYPFEELPDNMYEFDRVKIIAKKS